MKNKRVVIQHYGGVGGLHIIEEEIPLPKKGEVRVKVITAGVSYNEVMQQEGVFKNPALPIPKLPYTPGYDIYGIIEQTGLSVDEKYIGKRVIALTGTGGYAKYINLPLEEMTIIPEDFDLDPAQAVALVLNYVTAYQMLKRVARAKKGERILVHGGGGGVGSALLDLGRFAGLEMYATASTHKQSFIKGYGAFPIDYMKEDFVETIKGHSSNGVDIVFDCFGGSVSTRSYSLLKEKGRLVLFGDLGKMANGRPGNFFQNVRTISGISYCLLKNLIPWNNRTVSFYGIDVYKKKNPVWFKEDLNELVQLLSSKEIQPSIAEKVSLEGIYYAHERLSKRDVLGKLIVDMTK
ncbi:MULTISPECIES: zinc-binding dehydrogenase [unclassified Bacillus (in: firmicutes)]|uniref:zinc-binding dehydrogenase n=1 Tax=unclassified Bacillus (in: firmicutes) TaxID=185979 RepID=UPI0008E12E9B|nr:MULTISPECIES: zinc-binding dehydrogenase [unclassified Bacillus (in: firmicutes)]SFA78078.1 NADPH2:quinone reductase [Bacillus sp. UNCCL13]SFQ67987.1 NADPH2:quinone reductase [Bacillus sp. cl95]